MGAVTTITNALKAVLPTFGTTNADIESKIIDVVGTLADSEAMERNNTLNVINEALANQKITTVEYYRRKAVAFQYGDSLVYDPINQGGYYATLDTEKQIIKQAYVVGAYPNWTLLANALGTNGHLRKLTADELSSLQTYFKAFQPMGLELNVTSMDVAKIADPGLIIYVQTGTDAQYAADQITANLLSHEATLRETNTVTLTEIVDVIQQYEKVRAVSFSNPVATEVALDGSIRTVKPVDGIFNLTNGAFTFATPITTALIKTLA